MDVARTEAADAELMRMIERRSRSGEVDPAEREELWKESVMDPEEAAEVEAVTAVIRSRSRRLRGGG